MEDFLNSLNQSQREAVVYVGGPSLVVAGAGSGKTRVLTCKIAYLLNELDYEPWSILALTFTNKAAREMKERIARLVGEQRAKYLWMGTFHSVFSRILRFEAETLGFTPNFTIYDAADSKSLIKSIIKEMGLDEKVYKPASVEAKISRAKNYLLLPDAYKASRENAEADRIAKTPLINEIYVRYTERCRQSDAMDFDDLLLNTFLLFKQYPEICRKYSERFKYILVDEYQDTNFAQHSIVRQLTQDHQRVCVVGDDAQSIYSFRGADIDNILGFQKLYPETKLFKLEQNYRSTQTIVNAANSLIAKNKSQIRKEVYSKKQVGDLIQLASTLSDVEEGFIVADQIQRLHAKENCGYDEMAILYRTNAQSRVFEEEMRKRAIPYRVYGGLSFYQRKEIKDVIAYFRLAVNPNDEEAFKRIVNYPARGIGDTTLSKLVAAANAHGVSLWTVVTDPQGHGLSVNKGTANKLAAFREMIEVFVSMAQLKNAYDAGIEIAKRSGIINDLSQDRSLENINKLQNIEELVNGIRTFCEIRKEDGNSHIALTDFLADVSLLTDQDSDRNDKGPKLTMMTIHSAKGLEFRNVFIVGLEENLFPSFMSTNSQRELEEERRLFYVAITRAEEHCYLSYSKYRMRYGVSDYTRPSRFLRDIDSKYLSSDRNKFTDADNRKKKEPPTKPKRSWTATDISEKLNAPAAKVTDDYAKRVYGIDVGKRVMHERFGTGTVTEIGSTGDNITALVAFDKAGEKKLLLKFAKLKVIN